VKNIGSLIFIILGVIASIVISWWLVNALFGLIFFFVKVIIVAVVALLVFFALRGLFSGSGSSKG
jgi:hypothetical protein